MKPAFLTRMVLVFSVFSLAICVIAFPVQANQGVRWDDPIRLSAANKQTGQPALAVDLAGNVHVVWSEYSHNGISGEGDTLFYTTWDGSAWSRPLDIIAADLGEAAEYPEIVATPDGYLHITYDNAGLTSGLMYIKVHTCCTRDVLSWSKPVMLADAVLGQHALVTDSRGYLYLAFADNTIQKIIFLISKDGGETWSREEEIASGAQSPNDYPIFPRLAVSDSGRIHVVWNILPYPGRLILYAHSDDEGQTWSEPVIIDSDANSSYRNGYGPIYPDIETFGLNQVHIIWDGTPTVERNHIVSMDGGETWSEPITLFQEISMAGRAGWNEMAFDSAGTLHAITLGGPLHASWDGLGWTQSQDIALRNYAGQGEYVRNQIGLGNQIHVVWIDKETEPFAVWYVRGYTSSPPISPVVAPKPTAVIPLETQTVPPEMLTPVAQPTVLSLDDPDFQAASYSPGFAIAVGSILTIFVIVLAVLWAVRRQTFKQ